VDLSQLIGSLTLFILMIVVGLQLTVEDFRRVLATPGTIVVGTLGQILLLPVMTWGIASVVSLSPTFAAGAIILSASPGAGMSNVMAAVAGANVALSVTLTAVSSVLAVVTLPSLTALGLAYFVGDSVRVEVPVVVLMAQMGLFLLTPIGIGMFLRSRRGDDVDSYIVRANRIAIVAIVVLTVVSAATGDSELPDGRELLVALLAASLWTLCAMGIGFGLATLLDLDADDRFTFLVEFSARNIALAFIVAVSSLGRLELGFFSGAYAMTGFPAVFALALVRRRLARA